MASIKSHGGSGADIRSHGGSGLVGQQGACGRHCGKHQWTSEVDQHLQPMLVRSLGENLAEHEDAEVNHGHIEGWDPGVRLCPVQPGVVRT